MLIIKKRLYIHIAACLLSFSTLANSSINQQQLHEKKIIATDTQKTLAFIKKYWKQFSIFAFLTHIAHSSEKLRQYNLKHTGPSLFGLAHLVLSAGTAAITMGDAYALYQAALHVKQLPARALRKFLHDQRTAATENNAYSPEK